MYSNELICNILDFISQNINRKITISELSTRFFFNKDYIMRLFKRELQTTILEYINRVRIYNSLTELQTTTKSILNIGLNNGFASQEYYSETFHKIVGVSPLIYRKFTKRSNEISEEEYLTIQTSLANLSSFINQVTYYQNNRKKTLTKTLSIFKK